MKWILIFYFLLIMVGCGKTVRTTQQGQTYNSYKVLKYQNVSKKEVKKPKTRREKQNW
ncbi:hypothetical protein BH23BAC1_BH23BAC1_01170 [soil metagenome]